MRRRHPPHPGSRPESAAAEGPLDINEIIIDVIALTRSEVLRNGVSLETRLARDLPPIRGIESSCNRWSLILSSILSKR